MIEFNNPLSQLELQVLSSIEDTFAGMDTETKLLHLWKAFSPIEETL